MAGDRVFLTPDERARVLVAFRYLRVKLGRWDIVGRAVTMRTRTIRLIRRGGRVRMYVARKVAGAVGSSTADLIAGRAFAATACPHCGCDLGSAKSTEKMG
jgi:hypothetical protein